MGIQGTANPFEISGNSPYADSNYVDYTVFGFQEKPESATTAHWQVLSGRDSFNELPHLSVWLPTSTFFHLDHHE